MSDAVCYRAFRPGDEVVINEAFNHTFSLQRSLAEWGWKFPEEEGGRTIMIAEGEGQLLAHYAGQTCRLTTAAITSYNPGTSTIPARQREQCR